MHTDDLKELVRNSDYRLLARTLTKVENDLTGADEILKALKPASIPVIGITGPPGAGKSTLVNAILNKLAGNGEKVAVLAVDPTSPFNFGSLLGDRIRMSEQFNKPNIYIRSIATRGSLGGLSVKSIEMVDVLRSAGFDYVIVETVGVGQSEVEIAGLADMTIVVLVPEAGDEIQQIKSGLMEIADVFVVNKADRGGADRFASNLAKLVRAHDIPVIKTVAEKNEGIDSLLSIITHEKSVRNPRAQSLLKEKAWKLLQERLMSKVDRRSFEQKVMEASELENFNLYDFIEKEACRSR